MLLIEWIGWRMSFLVFGAAGAVWCAVFWQYYRGDPAQHPAASAADLAYAPRNFAPQKIRDGIRWKQIFCSANVWALFWMYFATSYGFWFLLTWLPTYLVRQHHMPLQL